MADVAQSLSAAIEERYDSISFPNKPSRLWLDWAALVEESAGSYVNLPVVVLKMLGKPRTIGETFEHDFAVEADFDIHVFSDSSTTAEAIAVGIEFAGQPVAAGAGMYFTPSLPWAANSWTLLHCKANGGWGQEQMRDPQSAAATPVTHITIPMQLEARYLGASSGGSQVQFFTTSGSVTLAVGDYLIECVGKGGDNAGGGGGYANATKTLSGGLSYDFIVNGGGGSVWDTGDSSMPSASDGQVGPSGDFGGGSDGDVTFSGGVGTATLGGSAGAISEPGATGAANGNWGDGGALGKTGRPGYVKVTGPM